MEQLRSFTSPFDISRCKECGECLHQCPVLQMTPDEAISERKKLNSGSVSAKIMKRCATCFACNLVCLQGCNPAQKIIDRDIILLILLMKRFALLGQLNKRVLMPLQFIVQVASRCLRWGKFCIHSIECRCITFWNFCRWQLGKNLHGLTKKEHKYCLQAF